MIKPIALIKLSRLNTPEQLSRINSKMKEHSMSEEYHILIAPTLDKEDVVLEIHNDENATESKIEDLRKDITELLANESK